MAPTVEIIEIGSTELGEGPHWDVDRQSLFFIDYFGKSIHKYVPATKEHRTVILDFSTAFVIPVKGQNDKFVTTKGNEIVVVTWDGISDKISNVQKVTDVDSPQHFVNDGKADPTGRLWTGTRKSIGEQVSSFISLTNGTLKTHINNVGLSNGLAFDLTLKKLYYIDSWKGTVDQFDLDVLNGEISNRKVAFTLKRHDIPGLPDGMTIDTDGNLWVAVFDGYRVLKIDPRKPETLLETVKLPAKQVTSVTFGGPNLDELYVTTGRAQLLGIENQIFTENDGLLYKITGLNTKGLPGESVVL